MTPLEALRYHVSGAVARGESQPITAIEGKPDMSSTPDTDLCWEALQNDQELYRECEAAARYAGFVTDNREDFTAELADELERIVNDNWDDLPGFSLTERMEYDEIDFQELAALYEFDDYHDSEDE